ncbi:MAG: SRPBCC family protein [Nocardioidaceae bacterium]
MIDLETSVEIARPVHEVFAFVADQTNAPQWQTDLREVRRLTDGPIGVGSEHEFVRTFAGRRFASRNRFVAFEPDRYVKFEIPSGWISGTASYRTEANGSEGTVLTSRMEFRIRGPLALLETVLTRLLAKDSRRDEERLKSLLEHGDPSVST